MGKTLEIHTLELERYNLGESDLAVATPLDRWLYWLLHAQEYEPTDLARLLPDTAIRQATQTITRIAEVTEDKAMYDAREKTIRDRQWALNATREEGRLEGLALGELKGKIEGKIEGKIQGKIEGEIRLIRMLQEILDIPPTAEAELSRQSLEELQAISNSLKSNLRNRKV